jgi:hypothetical protein
VVHSCASEVPFLTVLTRPPAGRLLTGLVLEYLEWAELDHTVQIYLPEADLPESRPSRAQLADSLGLSCAAKDKERPLLMVLLDARVSEIGASEVVFRLMNERRRVARLVQWSRTRVAL